MTVVFPEAVKPLSLLNPREWAGAVRFRDVREVFSPTEARFQIILSLYEAPVCTIPPLSFLVQLPDGARDTLKTDPIAVQVASILEQLDSAQLKRLAKYGAINPMRAGRLAIWETILVLALIIAAVVLLVLLIKKYLNRKNAQIITVPPFEEAMNALSALDSFDLISKSEYKAFVFSLSAILKRFVSRRYEVSIEEATSTEFKQWARRSGDLSRENKHLIENFINETDPVKFADLTPSVEILRKLRADVEEFVKRTRPIENLSST
ncbi:MAG: hypothetical protein FWE23_08170 [Chitinivibrionia bacterium]|nr:hypothetical protein [Chitinivibrionia bacterium]